MATDPQSVSRSRCRLPLSLRFIVLSFAFTAHHKHLRPPSADTLDVSTFPQFMGSLWDYIVFIIYIGSYIALLALLVRVTVRIFTETYAYFKREGLTTVSVLDYIRYGLEK